MSRETTAKTDKPTDVALFPFKTNFLDQMIRKNNRKKKKKEKKKKTRVAPVCQLISEKGCVTFINSSSKNISEK